MCVLENKALRRVFGSKTEEVTRDWGKLHDEELHCLYSFQNVIVIKSIEGEVGEACSTHWKDEKCPQNFSWIMMKQRDYLTDLDIYGMKIF